jgi:phage terminase large subunit-like protein
MASRPHWINPRPAWLEAIAEEPGFKWAVTAWARAAEVETAWFDAAKADAVVAGWPHWFHLTDDRFAGLPFKLNAWQEIIVRLLVGWKVAVEILDPETHQPTRQWVRLFRRLLLWVPRKNGKSEFLAALALLFWALDGIVGGQGYVFARDEDQAELPFNKMKAMVGYNPELAASIQSHKKSLYLKECATAFQLLTGAEEGKHGKGANVILGDEMHEWKSRKIETDLRGGTGTRLEPIELYASTAGLKTNLTGVELWDESLAILEGRVEEPTTLVALFAAEPEDDWRDEKVWARANPSLGLSPTVQFLRREARLAEGNPRREATFRCYHLNQWVESTARWLPIVKWDACTADREGWRNWEGLEGRRCFGGFDVSATRDFTALVWLFEPLPGEEKWLLKCRFWVPEDTLAQRIKDARNQVPLDRWHGLGAFETTPGDYVDQGVVEKAILDGFERFEVDTLAFDIWNARKLLGDLQTAGVDAEQMLEVRQGILSMGEPSKHFERLVFAGLIDHGGHPLLRWMAGNTVLRFDENLNFMPAKKRSPEKIDGVVASVMAVGAAFRDREDDNGGVGAWLNSLKQEHQAAAQAS